MVFVTGDNTSVFPGGGIGFIARGFVIVQQSLILYDDTLGAREEKLSGKFHMMQSKENQLS